MKLSSQIKYFIPILLIGMAIGYWLLPGKTAQTPDKTPEVHSSGHDHQAEESEGTIWTCSMHPQIRQPEPGQCPICGMDLIPLEEGSGNDDPLQFEMTEAAVQLANIQTTVVKTTGAIEKQVVLNGKITSDERKTWSQTAHIPGRIEKLYVSFTGEKVYKGQKIAEIYSPRVITAQQELLESIKYVDINPAMIESAKGKLRNWKIPEKDIEEIIRIGKPRETFAIYADASGVVTERHLNVGDHVMEGTVLYKLNNLSRLWVMFDAYEEDLQHIRKGDDIAFTVAAIPGRTFHTKITFIDPIINPKTRVASVRGEISNRKGLLKPEMFIRGTIFTKEDKTARIVLPKTAVLWTGKRSVVWVKDPKMEVPTFSYREVLLGPSTGEGYVITSGLQPGEEVVTYGAFAIDASAQLNNRQSMMNQLVKVESDPSGEEGDNTDGGMKCGPGKCGKDMKMKQPAKEKEEAMKCGEGKCGKSMKTEKSQMPPKSDMKCGAGKCGKDIK